MGALGGVRYGDTAGAGSLAVGGGGVNSGDAFTHSGEAHSGIRQAHLDHAFICGAEDVGHHRAFVIENEHILGLMHLDGVGRGLHMRGDHLRGDGHRKSEVGRAGEGVGVHLGCGRREGLHPVAFSVPGIDAGDAHRLVVFVHPIGVVGGRISPGLDGPLGRNLGSSPEDVFAVKAALVSAARRTGGEVAFSRGPGVAVIDGTFTGPGDGRFHQIFVHHQIVKARLPAELVEIFHRLYGGGVIHRHSRFDGLGACGQRPAGRSPRERHRVRSRERPRFFIGDTSLFL